jgi:hypothetical protein
MHRRPDRETERVALVFSYMSPGARIVGVVGEEAGMGQAEPTTCAKSGRKQKSQPGEGPDGDFCGLKVANLWGKPCGG